MSDLGLLHIPAYCCTLQSVLNPTVPRPLGVKSSGFYLEFRP
jgi:hypothetical protein